tara:strand:- start:43 stop:882 length:840 start_codon:yes stop_codon:yes gene_type:complete
MVKDAINVAIRQINQYEFSYPFNSAINISTVTPGVAKYTIPTNTKHIDYKTARIKKSETLGAIGSNLATMPYYEYIARDYANQEDEIESTTINATSGLSASVTTISVTSTTGFSATGTLFIGEEQITYTGILGNDFTGCTRGANSTTAAIIADDVTVTQFDNGGVPRHIVRTPDNNYILYPFPNKAYTIVFDFFTLPVDLTAVTDVPSLPEQFRTIIVEGAMYTAYMFRGETQEAMVMKTNFEEGIKNMRTLYINRYDYVSSTVINKSASSSMTHSRIS